MVEMEEGMLQETTLKEGACGGACELIREMKEIAQTLADLTDQTDLTRDKSPAEAKAIEFLHAGIELHAHNLDSAIDRLETHLTECQKDGRYNPDAKRALAIA
jgi:hypothetical protein